MYFDSVAVVSATRWLAAACWDAVGVPDGTGAMTMPSDMVVAPLTLPHTVDVVCAEPPDADEPGCEFPMDMPAIECEPLDVAEGRCLPPPAWCPAQCVTRHRTLRLPPTPGQRRCRQQSGRSTTAAPPGPTRTSAPSSTASSAASVRPRRPHRHRLFGTTSSADVTGTQSGCEGNVMPRGPHAIGPSWKRAVIRLATPCRTVSVAIPICVALSWNPCHSMESDLATPKCNVVSPRRAPIHERCTQ